MTGVSENKSMKKISMKKKKNPHQLFLWLLQEVLSLLDFTDKIWEAISRMSIHELISLPFD